MIPMSFVPTDIPLNCEFVVNFSPGLSEAILESKYLEKLGYAIPSLARSVALQEEKFIAFQDSLNRCLQRYHSAIEQLTEAEVSNLYNVHVHILNSMSSCNRVSYWMIILKP